MYNHVHVYCNHLHKIYMYTYIYIYCIWFLKCWGEHEETCAELHQRCSGWRSKCWVSTSGKSHFGLVRNSFALRMACERQAASEVLEDRDRNHVEDPHLQVTTGTSHWKIYPHIPLSISVHRSSYGVHSSSISLLLRVRCLYPMLSLVSLCASNRQKIRYLNHFFPPRKSGEEWLGCRKECQKFRFESVACAALLPWPFRTLSSLMPLLL